MRAPAGASGPRTCQIVSLMLHAAAALDDRLGEDEGLALQPAGAKVELRVGRVAVLRCRRNGGRSSATIADSTTKPTTCSCHGQSIRSALIPIRIAAMPNQRKKKPGSSTSMPSRTSPRTHHDQPPSVVDECRGSCEIPRRRRGVGRRHRNRAGARDGRRAPRRRLRSVTAKSLARDLARCRRARRGSPTSPSASETSSGSANARRRKAPRRISARRNS